MMTKGPINITALKNTAALFKRFIDGDRSMEVDTWYPTDGFGLRCDHFGRLGGLPTFINIANGYAGEGLAAITIGMKSRQQAEALFNPGPGDWPSRYRWKTHKLDDRKRRYRAYVKKMIECGPTAEQTFDMLMGILSGDIVWDAHRWVDAKGPAIRRERHRPSFRSYEWRQLDQDMKRHFYIDGQLKNRRAALNKEMTHDWIHDAGPLPAAIL